MTADKLWTESVSITHYIELGGGVQFKVPESDLVIQYTADSNCWDDQLWQSTYQHQHKTLHTAQGPLDL